MVVTPTLPILDGHNDTLTRLVREGRSFLVESTRGQLDLPRARRGGLAGGFFAICPVPPSSEEMRAHLIFTENGYEVRPFAAANPAVAHRHTMEVAAQLFRLEAEAQGQVKIVRHVDELELCLRTGVLAIILHFEGAEAIDEQLDALEVFYQAGLRSLGLVWSRPNVFGHGVPFKFPHSPDTGPGLTPAGRDLVRACNRLGILLDLAHINEQGFWDVAQISEKPLVVTHAAAYALCPSTRNLTDRQLDAIKASEGIVGLNFETSNLREDAFDTPDTPIDLMVRHIDHLVAHAGIDGVGFGSDFDGGITVAQELGDVTGLPRLIAALREHGYDEASLRKLAYENWLRVLRKTWRS